MTIDDFMLTVFCVVDDLLKESGFDHLRSRGPQPALADSEVITMITIELVGEFLGLDRDVAVFTHFRRYHLDAFPKLAQVHRTTFARQAANLWAVKQHLLGRLAERAKSMAQLTKVGHVDILSNIGSFGEDVFKVGMTRRLEPLDRVKELGDASVPFPFDVHAMIGCENAPTLENALHRALARHRVNRVNLRKEYFQVPLDLILEAVRKHHGVIEYVAEAEALEYRETQGIDPEDLVELEAELAEIGGSFEDDEDQ